VQESAYGAQPKVQRAERHRRYAGWLRAHPAEAAGELYAIIGWHLEQAHRLMRVLATGYPQNDEIARAAAEALAAAARTRISADVPTATGLLERAAALTIDAPQLRARRLLEVAHLHWQQMNSDAATRALDEVEALGPAAGTAELTLVAASWDALATSTTVDVDLRPAIVHARAAFDAAAEAQWPWGQALARRFEANAHNARGAWREMGPLLEEATAIATAAGETYLADENLMYSWAVARWGPTTVQDGLALSARVHAALADAPATRSRAEKQLAALLAMDGDVTAARAAMGAAPGLDEGLTYTFWAFCGVTVEDIAGDDRRAAEIATAGGDVARAHGDVGFSSTLYGLAAVILADLGDGAAADLTATARDSSPVGDTVSQSLWRVAAALLTARDGDADRTRQLVEEAVEWMDRSDQINEQADVRRRAANAMLRIGDDAAARRLLEEALDRYRAKGNKPMVLRCEQELVARA
jgi:hypothetical protein